MANPAEAKNQEQQHESQQDSGSSSARQESSSAGWWKPALAVFGEVTGWIVAPIVGALYLGRYLDEKYGTTNVYFLLLTAAAFIISCTGIGIIGARYIREMEKENKEKEKDFNGDRNKQNGK